jgi:hypothetical protein
MIEQLAEDVSPVLPEDGLSDTIQAFVETCAIQLDWSFEETTDQSRQRPLETCRGSALALTGESGTWVLVSLCDIDSSLQLTNMLFAMDEEEDVVLEDVADALNEIMNVAAGTFKSKREAAGERLSIGLPIYLDGDEAVTCLDGKLENMTGTIRTREGVCLQLYAF